MADGIIPWDKLGSVIPAGDQIGQWITLFAWLVVVLIAGLIAIAFMYFFVIYNKKIIVVKRIPNRGTQVIARDRARVMKVGKEGAELLWCFKHKKFLPAYSQMMGRNTYMFAINRSGFWLNVILGDVDERLRELKIEPLHEDMRYMHSGIKRNVENRFDQKSWWQENAAWVINMAMVIIVLVFLWLVLRDATKLIDGLNAAAESIHTGAEAMQRAAASMDNYRASGGLVSQG